MGHQQLEKAYREASTTEQCRCHVEGDTEAQQTPLLWSYLYGQQGSSGGGRGSQPGVGYAWGEQSRREGGLLLESAGLSGGAGSH